ncbi:MAG: hypothetical protein Q9195_006293 [Heterodermia aff. obscurata]
MAVVGYLTWSRCRLDNVRTFSAPSTSTFLAAHHNTATNYGFGWHTADMSPERYVAYYKWIYISSPIYLLTLLGYKLSILLLYLRLFGVNSPFRYTTYALTFLITGYLFSNLLTQLFGCHPVAKYWQPALYPGGHCITSTTADYAYGSLNFISDLFIFVLPMPMVWRLKLSRREKLGVTLVFMGGAM